MTINRTAHQKRMSWQQVMAATACFAFVVAVTAVGEDMARVEAKAPGHPIPSAPKKTYTPASVYAEPELQCKLYANGSKPSAGLDVYTDDDGYARFHAVRASADDKVKQLNLDCTDSAGHPSAYAVDLTSDDTFTPRPLDLAKERGIDRPKLSGDPLSYTQAELLKAGYGLRPDPKENPEAYSRWLRAASISGRMLEGKRATSPHLQTVNTGKSKPGNSSELNAGPSGPGIEWTGSVLSGAPQYSFSEAEFNVPYAIPSADETTSTEISIWVGLNGNAAQPALIQGGIFINTTPSTRTYYSFRELCCGGGENGFGGNFTPQPGDELYSQQWYCDANGKVNLNGGYGCSFLEDDTSGAVFNCSQANGSPCASVPINSLPGTPVLGQRAEFIIEDDSPELTPPTIQFTDFTPSVTMSGSAYSSGKNKAETVSTDPSVTVLQDHYNSTSHISVSLRSPNQTIFSVSQFAQVPGSALASNVPCAGPGRVCYAEAIAVGANANGSTIGDPWVLGSAPNEYGDHNIYHWVNSQWVLEPGGATQIAVSPPDACLETGCVGGGVPWVINHAGQIFYWNGSTFELAPGDGCATSIGVGPASRSDPYGSPWVIGCNGSASANGGIYFLGGTSWYQKPGAASQIAVSPEGIPWVITANGSIYRWNFTNWTPVSGCATSIAVGPTTAPQAGQYGDVWVVGCPQYGVGQIYQLLNGRWVAMPGPAATQISVSPDLGVPWVITASGAIYE